MLGAFCFFRDVRFVKIGGAAAIHIPNLKLGCAAVLPNYPVIAKGEGGIAVDAGILFRIAGQ